MYGRERELVFLREYVKLSALGHTDLSLKLLVPLWGFWFFFKAFSHFTFERSGHQLIVVDIQGVGDLYTDPQIHTSLGTDFGDGNLGNEQLPAHNISV